MIMNRAGEQDLNLKRSKRIYKQDSYWYYLTREQIHIGPFDTYSEAEAGVGDFVDFVLHAEPNVIKTLSMYKQAAA